MLFSPSTFLVNIDKNIAHALPTMLMYVGLTTDHVTYVMYSCTYMLVISNTCVQAVSYTCTY